MKSKRPKMTKKKGKSWIYFSKSTKKTEPSESEDHLLKVTTQSPSSQNVKQDKKIVHKKNKRKRKLPKTKNLSETNNNVIINHESDQVGDHSRGNVDNEKDCDAEQSTKSTKLTDARTATNQNAVNSLKAKRLKKKQKRKLRILKRKAERAQSLHETKSSQEEGLASGGNEKRQKKSKKVARSDAVRPVVKPSVAQSEGPKEEKPGKRRRKRKLPGTQSEQMAEISEKRQRVGDIPDSGMSSGTETPHLPQEPQDVASNWKALMSKLKASEPSKARKSRTPKTSRPDQSDSKEETVWFDDVDPALLEAENVSCAGKGSSAAVGSDWHFEAEGVDAEAKITKCLALDCEMVGIGLEGKGSILARVSMVNEYGQCIYDKFVKPREKVTDYRTEFSGVRPRDLFRGNAEEFLTVQKEVAALMKDRVLVGHALSNDMRVLYLGHPRRLMRDTQKYPHFREVMKTKRSSLKKLAKTVLGVTVQEGEHSSVEDARTAMRLYTLNRIAWEKSLKHKGHKVKK